MSWRSSLATTVSTLRINTRDYRDLKNALRSRIDVAHDVIISSSLDDKFVEAFRHTIEENGTVELDEATIEVRLLHFLSSNALF